MVQKMLEQNVRDQRERTDVVITIEGIVRANIARRLPTFSEIAAKQNTSERTLRRRLANVGFTYDALL